MNTKLVNSAAGVINAALTQCRTAAGIALALESAQMLMTPETAAELVTLRARIAELEALTPAAIQTCRGCGAGYTYGEPCQSCVFRARMAAETDGITQRIVPTQALQLGPLAEWVAETFSPKPRPCDDDPNGLHHTYRVGRDLPETGGAR